MEPLKQLGAAREYLKQLGINQRVIVAAGDWDLWWIDCSGHVVESTPLRLTLWQSFPEGH